MQRNFRLVEIANLKPMRLKPSDRMVQSVRQHGILSPVLLAEQADDDGVIGLEIVDGNRRVAAANLAGLAKIPAVVYQQADAGSLAAVTVITNTLRSKNMVSEWKALESLRDIGQNEFDIAALTGLTAQSVRTRLRPGSMPPVLRDAIESGKITPSTAEAVTRLDHSAQRKLVSEFERKGFLERADVDALRPRPQPGPNAATQAQPQQYQPTQTQQPPHADSRQTFSDSDQSPEMEPSPQPEADAESQPQDPDATAESHESSDDPRAFVARLDAAMLSLARETRDRNLPRSVWIDRAIRAWDLTEPE